MSRVESYAQAVLSVVTAEGRATEAADELFRFARTFESNDQLRDALVDSSLPLERRLAVVNDLLGETALRVTLAVVTMIVTAGRSAELAAIVDRFVELAAASRDQAVAEVRTAVPLDEETTRRLAESLSSATGKRVEVKVILDESVLGGLVARVGDTVIDGSVRSRLEQLREGM